MANKEYITSQLDDIIKALNNIRNSVAESKEVCDVVIPTDRGFVFNPYILSF